MHSNLREDEPMSEINLVPLIDIALTLVIILMVTTVFIHNPGVKLNLPKTVTHEGDPETPKDLTIAIAATGATYLDGRPVQPAALQAALIKADTADQDTRVLIKGDRTVAYQKVMDVMDMVKQSGLSRVMLPTDPKTP